MDYRDFATRIRTKFPGSYEDLDDETLARKLVAKYPTDYSDVTFAGSVGERLSPHEPEGAYPSVNAGMESPPRITQQEFTAPESKVTPTDVVRGMRTVAPAEVTRVAPPTTENLLLSDVVEGLGRGVARGLRNTGQFALDVLSTPEYTTAGPV